MRRRLIVCGWDEVFVLDMSVEPAEKVWSWRADKRPELAEIADQFKTTDECKPVGGIKARAGRSHMLITSSSGGVALIERETGKAMFQTTAPNAHSVDLLPGGRAAVASSGSWGWNELVLYDIDGTNEPLWRDDLPWAHGVIWDDGRDTLWALGGTELRAYKPRDWDSPAPSLERRGTYPLPTPGGHDLSVEPGTSRLIVTSNEGVYLFDREAKTFTPHPDLGDLCGVKCVAMHPTTGRIAYVRAEPPNWWAERIHFLHPDAVLHLPEAHIYKVRWDADDDDGRNAAPPLGIFTGG